MKPSQEVSRAILYVLKYMETDQDSGDNTNWHSYRDDKIVIYRHVFPAYIQVFVCRPKNRVCVYSTEKGKEVYRPGNWEAYITHDLKSRVDEEISKIQEKQKNLKARTEIYQQARCEQEKLRFSPIDDSQIFG